MKTAYTTQHLELIGKQEELAKEQSETQFLIDEYSTRVQNLKQQRKKIEHLRLELVDLERGDTVGEILKRKKKEYQLIQTLCVMVLLQRFFTEGDSILVLLKAYIADPTINIQQWGTLTRVTSESSE